jgi:hypothetical protein
MPIRTDLQYREGGIAVANNANADQRKALPPVELTTHLLSNKFSVSILNDVGENMANDPQLNSALNIQAELVASINGIVEQRNNQDPDISQSKHLKEVNNRFKQVESNYVKNFDIARENIAVRQANLDQEFEQKLKFDTSQAKEIREVLRSMDDGQKRDLINEAIESGDGSMLAAVLNTHPSTLTISAKEQRNYRNTAMKKHAPDIFKLKNGLSRAQGLLFDAFTGLIESRDNLTAKSVLDQYQDLANKAEKARQAAV